MKLEVVQSLLTQYLDRGLYPLSSIDALSRYLCLIHKWNQTYNLTAITDPKKMVIYHLLDSLVINPYITGKSIIDVGSGAGLPGIPLAIVFPDKRVTLLDSNSKKTRFLNQVKLELNLKQVEVVHSRAESYQPALCFDLVVTRAFSSIHAMLCATKQLCCEDGKFLAMKGIYPAEELSALPDGFVVEAVHRLNVPDLAAERHLVCIKKG